MAVAVTAGKPPTRTPRTAERTMPESQRMAIHRGHIRRKVENCQMEGIAIVRDIRDYLNGRLDQIEEELIAANRYSSQGALYDK